MLGRAGTVGRGRRVTIRANERLIELPRRAGERAQRGPIDSPEAVAARAARSARAEHGDWQRTRAGRRRQARRTGARSG